MLENFPVARSSRQMKFKGEVKCTLKRVFVDIVPRSPDTPVSSPLIEEDREQNGAYCMATISECRRGKILIYTIEI